MASASAFKNGTAPIPLADSFRSFLTHHVPRTLKHHQFKAALHLILARNGANFSVPGSGKTSVVLAAFAYLRQQGEVDALFVVGPPSCFGPWCTEYTETLGIAPKAEILAGGDVNTRRAHYEVNRNTVADLYLTTFHTLYRDCEHVCALFATQGIRFFLVIDEAHYMKQLGGAWATAILSLVQSAAKRCILTGTPFPRSYSDAFNLFDALWPESPPITEHEKHSIDLFCQKNRIAEAASVLDRAISPLFYRVRKADLGLAPQRFHPPILVPMQKHEKRVYDAILDRIRDLSRAEYFRDVELVLRLRRGRMIRLRQCISHVALLKTAVDEYNEDLLEDDLPLSDLIKHYDKLETPGKLQALVQLVGQMVAQGEKVLIWSNFVLTLERIREQIAKLNSLS